MTVFVSKISVFNRIQQVTSATVGSLIVCEITKWQEYSPAVTLNPVERQRDRLFIDHKVNFAETPHSHGTVIFEMNVERCWLWIRFHREHEAPIRVIGIVVQ